MTTDNQSTGVVTSLSTPVPLQSYIEERKAYQMLIVIYTQRLEQMIKTRQELDRLIDNGKH